MLKDLTDSEEVEETDEDEGDSSENEEQVSSDSGADTGMAPITTGSSDEAVRKIGGKKKVKQVTKKTQEKKKNNKTSIEIMSAKIQEDKVTAPVQQKGGKR